MQAQALNDDWIKTRSWDIWLTDANGHHVPVRSAPQLFQFLGVQGAPLEAKQEAIARFLGLPAARSMPEVLRKELVFRGYPVPPSRRRRAQSREDFHL